VSGVLTCFSSLDDVDEAERSVFIVGYGFQFGEKAGVLVLPEKVVVPFPVVGDLVGGERHGSVREKHVVSELNHTIWRYREGVRSFGQDSVMLFVEAGGFGGETLFRIVDQELVTGKLKNRFGQVDEFHVAKFKSSVMLLAVEGSEAAGVGGSRDDSVTFTQVVAVDLVTLHKVGKFDLNSIAVADCGDGEYITV